MTADKMGTEGGLCVTVTRDVQRPSSQMASRMTTAADGVHLTKHRLQGG